MAANRGKASTRQRVIGGPSRKAPRPRPSPPLPSVADPSSSKPSDMPRGIIPGLPDEVVLKCLARVPFVQRSAARQTCHTWRQALASKELHETRGSLGLVDELVCVCVGERRLGGEVHLAFKLIDLGSGESCYMPPLPLQMTGNWEAFHGYACVGVGTQLLLIGGGGDGGDTWRNLSKEVWAFDTWQYTWRRMPPMRQGRLQPMVAVSDSGHVIIAGSEGVRATKSVEILDPILATWREGKDVPQDAWQTPGGAYSLGESVCFVQNVIGTSGMIQRAHVYDVDDDKWHTVEPFAARQSALQVVQSVTTLGGTVYAVAKSQNFSLTNEWVPTVVRHNAQDCSWEHLVNLPHGVSSGAAPHHLWKQTFRIFGLKGGKLGVIESPVARAGRGGGILLHVLSPEEENSWKVDSMVVDSQQTSTPIGAILRA